MANLSFKLSEEDILKAKKEITQEKVKQVLELMDSLDVSYSDLIPPMKHTPIDFDSSAANNAKWYTKNYFNGTPVKYEYIIKRIKLAMQITLKNCSHNDCNNDPYIENIRNLIYNYGEGFLVRSVTAILFNLLKTNNINLLQYILCDKT